MTIRRQMFFGVIVALSFIVSQAAAEDTRFSIGPLFDYERTDEGTSVEVLDLGIAEFEERLSTTQVTCSGDFTLSIACRQRSIH